MKKLTLISILFLAACTKITPVPTPAPIDLGVKSTSTSIKSISQANNVITAEFETTVGSKYSVQIVPFGKDEPVKKDGFTAMDITTKKVYDLSALAKKDYDLIFIDISGKEIKYPLIIK
jgi:hypothetical protein